MNHLSCLDVLICGLVATGVRTTLSLWLITFIFSVTIKLNVNGTVDDDAMFDEQGEDSPSRVGFTEMVLFSSFLLCILLSVFDM